nr:MAG TPA: Cytosine specific methyltransferase [Caudoviricetes sp.]
MRVLSLFDGISCGMIALERVGVFVEKYVAYEVESNAIKISKKNYKQIEHKGDVRTADFTQYRGYELLIGGSPCQSLSIIQSKTRENLNGKSKLFFEFVRALEEVKPKYFLFENVSSMKAECRTVISECLGCAPIYIDSADFSAQSRPRYYWTNIPVIKKYEKSKAVLKDILESNVNKKYFYSYPLKNVDMTKQVCATMDFKNHEIHKRVFNSAFKCHTLTACSGGHHQKKVMDNGVARKLTPLEYERLQTLPDNYTAGVCDTARYTAVGNAWTVDVIAHILRGIKKRTQGVLDA